MTNPYAAPDAELTTKVTTEGEFSFHSPQTVPAGRGASWLSEGFAYFKRSPGHWVLTCIVAFGIMMILQMIPLVSMLAGVLTWVWVGGVVIGVKAQHDGQPFNVSYLFAGFQQKFVPLLLIGVVTNVISYALIALLLGSMYFQLIGIGAEPDFSAINWPSFLIRILIYFALIMPVIMAVWFAPALIVLHNHDVLDAMKLSFHGCIKNILPFLVYGLVATFWMILGSIPLGLGLLIVIPMLYASLFVAYKEIYVD